MPKKYKDRTHSSITLVNQKVADLPSFYSLSRALKRSSGLLKRALFIARAS